MDKKDKKKKKALKNPKANEKKTGKKMVSCGCCIDIFFVHAFLFKYIYL